MKAIKLVVLFFVLGSLKIVAQSAAPQSAIIPNGAFNAKLQSAQKQLDPVVQDGNGSLGFLYDTTLCGLNYTQHSLKLSQRVTPVGVVQPAPFPITAIPVNAQIEKAYLWCVAVGNGGPITATITNPAANTSNFLMANTGQDIDLCWGFPGTYSYRADVTSCISGNGNYIISGLPVGTSISGSDVEGATLMIIYKDVSATYTGSIHIDDGCLVMLSGTAQHSMIGFNACATSAFSSTFMIVADLQNLGATLSMNNGPSFGVLEDWYNYVSDSTTITQAQSTCNFSVSSGNDCFCLSVAGLYTQTNCNNCVTANNENGLVSNSIHIFPNPNAGEFELNITTARSQTINLIVVDQLGQRVFEQAAYVQAGKQILNVNLEKLKPGNYFVQIRAEEGIVTKLISIH